MAYEENRAYAEKPLSDEQVEINYLKNTVSRLESLIGALCATNFLTQHEDGDEEAREHAVARVNREYRRYADDFKAKKEIEALEQQKAEIEQKIENAKYGTIKYNTVGRYATALGGSMFDTQKLMNKAIATSAFIQSEPSLQIGSTSINEKDLKAVKALSNGSK